MTARTPSGTARRVPASLWANRPSLGGWALLLGGPVTANQVFGWPLWPVVAVQWSLAALIWVFVAVAEARRPPNGTPRPGRDLHSTTETDEAQT